ncbi:non-classical arabinogalactan protein 30-like [Triticum dicoccoides]|uniref:non-classical arabinogalactan protein 30-like n=1 Tax=Triticum dicoccoides TaxID=85692 RepID=UPI000E7A3678|nr:non-classical arabinogalactan protein 30-like [Triticum dicoccoides]
MALLARCLLLCLALVVLSMGSLPSRSSAMGLPRPPPNVNFTIGVEGAVWCKGCRYAGYVKSRNASPIPNAAALLRCKRGKWALSVWGATDGRGYFQIQTAQQSAPFTSKNCKVYVLGSPVRACGVPVKPRGNKGSPLKFRKFVTLPDGLQALYTAGDFVFGPKKPGKC